LQRGPTVGAELGCTQSKLRQDKSLRWRHGEPAEPNNLHSQVAIALSVHLEWRIGD
jgi:hypothetical protein